jgi:hypothetical protein
MAKNVETRDVVAAFVANKGNAAAAARDLGIGQRTAYARLKTPEGQVMVAEYAGELLEQYRVSAMRVVGEAAAIGFSDITQTLNCKTAEDLLALPVQVRAAIAQIEQDSDGNIIKVRMHPKLDALKLLAMYTSIAGLGDTGDPTSTRPELGGLTIVGGTDTKANQNDSTTPPARRVIPRPEKLD